MLCASCGSKGLHIGCGRLEWNITEWDCDDCSQLVGTGRKSNNSSLSQEAGSSNPARRSLTFPSTQSTIVNVSPARVGSRSAGAIKRPHQDDRSISGADDESEVDITSISDGDSSSAKSLRYDSSNSSKQNLFVFSRF